MHINSIKTVSYSALCVLTGNMPIHSYVRRCMWPLHASESLTSSEQNPLKEEIDKIEEMAVED